MIELVSYKLHIPALTPSSTITKIEREGGGKEGGREGGRKGGRRGRREGKEEGEGERRMRRGIQIKRLLLMIFESYLS